MPGPDIDPIIVDASDTIYSPQLKITDEILEAVEVAPRGDAFSFGATPLDKLASMGTQGAVIRRLLAFAENYPDDVPEVVSRYVHGTLHKRLLGRGEANDENFTTRLVQDYEAVLEPALLEMVERARKGEASPAELLIVRDVLGIRSIELACMTHTFGEVKGFYNTMAEALEDMRSAVKYAVDILDGLYYDEPQKTRFRVKEAIGDSDDGLAPDDSPGLLMTRKRNLGILPDGTVVRERSSFVLRIDEESKFFAMFGAAGVERAKAIRFLAGDEQEEAIKEFEDLIEAYLESYEHINQTVPISTTIYAFNEATAEKVLALSERRAADKEKFLQESNMEIDFTPTEEELRIQAEIDEERRRAVEYELAVRRINMVIFNKHPDYSIVEKDSE